MRRIKLTIAYDGTAYNGWQRQNNAIGIEQVLEDAINTIFNEKNRVIGASRTDTGVHARGQVAIFDTNKKIPIDKIPHAINSSLPEDIVVLKAEEVNEDFHPRYYAKNKTYEYNIYNGDFLLPEKRFNTVLVRSRLDVSEIKKALPYFLGTHDFNAFCSSGTSVKSTIRTINELSLVEDNGYIKIRINGDGFLYNMVRIIVGTLLEVGYGKRKSDDIKNIIDSLDRNKAGITAPAKGLILEEIKY